ncbi:MAG TPA: hypothetical protein PLB16_00195 [bacterium]|jgi:tellurite resistance protein|nr:hypothetical protein [bacterium]
MFLSQLNFEQKKLFLGFAYAIIHADGVFNSYEEAYLNSICAEMMLGRNDFKQCQLSDFAEVFKTNKSRKIFLVESIAIALSDKDYDNKEKELILNLAKTFNISDKDVSTAELMVKSFIDFQLKFNEFIL